VLNKKAERIATQKGFNYFSAAHFPQVAAKSYSDPDGFNYFLGSGKLDDDSALASTPEPPRGSN
jgi:hypothetical protein